MKKIFLTIGSIVLNIFLLPAISYAALPTLKIGVSQTENPTEVVTVVKIIVLLTILALAPSILIMVTSFTRIIVVLSFLRHALGIGQLPPNQLLIGLSLFLTFFIMFPVIQTINENALQPYINEKISQDDALKNLEKPLREFMFSQTREKDLGMFMSLVKKKKPANKEEVSTFVLIPAFMISELKTAFQIGFLIFLPFLILDMVVASVLMAMGMMMLPPVIISLPFKLLLFVLVDGWQLIVGSLLKSFG